LHVRKGRHAAFASDVLEILRPRLTKFAMDLIDQEVLEIKDWERTKDYVKLKRQALVKVLEEFNGIKEELLDLLKVYIKDLEEKFLEQERGLGGV